MGELDFVPEKENIQAKYSEGESVDVTLHDGNSINLQKLDGNYDPRDQDKAVSILRKYRGEGKVVTGLLYINEDANEMHETLKTSTTPLNAIPMNDLCPGIDELDKLNKSYT